ncbi:MAG: signal peptidase II [Novosphingobium sp.]
MSLFTARPRLTGLSLAALIFVVDQWLKDLVQGPLGLLNEGDHLPLLPFFDLTRVHNYGVSLGMLTATSAEMRWGLVALTAGIAAIVFIWLLREKVLGEIVPLGMILGGALGNIVDRWSYGYVLDYADFHIGSFRPFLVFNLADAAITIGVVIILARSFLIREKSSDQPAGASATETNDHA